MCVNNRVCMLPISVIIPTYNRAEFITRAVSSVLDQTRSCSEIIIVDDGSTDDTEAVLHHVLADLPLECNIVRQQNLGPAAARNAGIVRARYPYIAFLDSDDHWVKHKLAVQYQMLSRSENLMISHTKERWLRRGEHLNQKKIHIPRDGDIFAHCLRLCAVGMSTVMLRRAVFDKVGMFDEQLHCCEDYDFWLRVSSRFEFLLVDMPLTVKEGGRDDQVSVQYRQGMDRLRIDSLKKIMEEGGLSRQQHFMALREFERKSKIFGRGCIKHGKVDLGREVLEELEVQKSNFNKIYPDQV